MCRHRVQFYDTDSFLARKVVEFLRPALREGGSAVVIATPEHIARFKSLFDSDDTLELSHGEGARIHWFDAQQTLDRFMDGSYPDEARFRDVIGSVLRRASDEGSGTVAAFGEMVALLYAQGHVEGAARLEALWDAMFDSHRFALLCAYPMDAFSQEHHVGAFRAICDAHSDVAPLEQHEGVADDAEVLYRVIAQLQQQANAAAAARTPRRGHEGAKRKPATPLAGRTAAPVPASGVELLSLEAAAQLLALSRPHVLKLVAEQRFESVVLAHGVMPLIPRDAVQRMAQQLGSAERD